MFDPKKPKRLDPAARLPKVGTPTPEQVRAALSVVVSYNWDEEMRDFNENPSPDHVFMSLRVLNAYRVPEGDGR